MTRAVARTRAPTAERTTSPLPGSADWRTSSRSCTPRSAPRSSARCPTRPPRGTGRRTPSTSIASASCATIDRRLRFLSKRLDDVQIVNPPDQPRRDRVFFGATVTVEDDDGGEGDLPHRRRRRDRRRRRRHLLAVPVGRALLGKVVGDIVTVRWHAGLRELTVAAIAYPDPRMIDRPKTTTRRARARAPSTSRRSAAPARPPGLVPGLGLQRRRRVDHLRHVEIDLAVHAARDRVDRAAEVYLASVASGYRSLCSAPP